MRGRVGGLPPAPRRSWGRCSRRGSGGTCRRWSRTRWPDGSARRAGAVDRGCCSSGITAVALARDVDVAAPAAPAVGVHPVPVFGAGCTDRRGVDEIEEFGQDPTSCASRISVILRAIAGKSLGSMRILLRPLVICRTGRWSVGPAPVLQRASVDSTGSGAVAYVAYM